MCQVIYCVGGVRRPSLDHLVVLVFLAFWCLFGFEPDPLAFLQGLKSISLNRWVMDKNVLSINLLDEAVAFLLIEPLYLSFWHSNALLLLKILGKSGVGP